MRGDDISGDPSASVPESLCRPIGGPDFQVAQGNSSSGKEGSDGETQQAALAFPFHGQCAEAPKAPGCQLDGLAASEDVFDDVRGQECELDIVADVARIDPFAASDLADRLDFSSGQLIEPAVRPGK